MRLMAVQSMNMLTSEDTRVTTVPRPPVILWNGTYISTVTIRPTVDWVVYQGQYQVQAKVILDFTMSGILSNCAAPILLRWRSGGSGVHDTLHL